MTTTTVKPTTLQLLTKLVDTTLTSATNTLLVVDNITSAAADGSGILADHAAYYRKLHHKHDAIKQVELTSLISGLDQDVQDLITKFS